MNANLFSSPPGEKSPKLLTSHAAAVLRTAQGSLVLREESGIRVGNGAGRFGGPAAESRPAPQHQDEAGERDRHLQEAPGARGGQVGGRVRGCEVSVIPKHV